MTSIALPLFVIPSMRVNLAWFLNWSLFSVKWREVYSIRYFKYLLLQLRLWNIVCRILKEIVVFVTCKWYGVCHVFPAHIVFPAITRGATPYFVDYFCFLNLSLKMVFPPRKSLRFFVLLNDVIGVFVNDFLIVSFICNIGQSFCMNLDTFRAVRLYDITNAMRLLILEIFEQISRSALSKLLALLIFLLCHLLYSVFERISL